MTNRSDVEQALDLYLAEGAEQAPDRVVDAALDRIEHTSQRHALRMPRRFPEMPAFLKSAMVGVAVVAVLIVGGVLLTRGPTTNLGGPPATSSAPSASAPASVSASPLPSASVALMDTSNWVAFTSARYGYQIAHPPTWTSRAATRQWAADFDFGPSTSADQFRHEGAILYAYADDVPSDKSENDWIFDQLQGCSARFEDAQLVSVDGHPGRIFIREACEDARAYFFIDERVHVFVLWRGNQQALLETFLSTIEFE